VRGSLAQHCHWEMQASALLRSGGLLGLHVDEQAARQRGLTVQRRAEAAASGERAHELRRL
jgi:hypothetical protein